MTFVSSIPDTDQPRDKLRAVTRGLRERCPACGEGAMFRAYLKVADHCPACDEALHHQRADDAPPYVTMFIVAHVIVTAILAADTVWPDAPAWLVALVFCALACLLSLAILPRVKGALVGWQWSLRMHGFGNPDHDETGAMSRIVGGAPGQLHRS